MKNLYFALSLKEVSRLLSLLDKNPFSPTYGCFDRTYWKYKIKDYVNARFQEACFTLALLYKNKYPGNTWYRKKQLRDFAIAAIEFWTKIQNKDGSFNEYYPNEHSHVATSFSAYAVANTYKLLNLTDEKILNSLRKAAEWLNKNDDLIVANHDAGAAVALYMIYELTKDKKYLNYCNKKIEKVLNIQDEEGWFNEYGGADMGYQSFTIYYLADYWEKTKDEKVFLALKKAVDFFSYFIHPDKSIGGHYGNRETSFILPTGFMILSKKMALANSIANAIIESLFLKRVIGPYSFDDRFLSDGLYPYLQTHYRGSKGPKVLPIYGTPFEKYFKNCSLYVKKTPRFYVIINTKRGGVMKVFKNDKVIHNDTGWVTKKDGNVFTTAGPSSVVIENDKINIMGSFYKINFNYLNTPKLIGTRVLAPYLKPILRRNMILSYKRIPIKFTREILIKNNLIKILDRFFPIPKNLELTNNLYFIYSTSTEMYQDTVMKMSKAKRVGNSVKIVIE